MDVSELLLRPEGKTLEFKRDLSSPDKILRTIVAFANTGGGTVLIGVEDSGDVRGIDDVLDAEERLASIISDNIVPKLVPSLEILSWRRTQLLAVQVYPSPSRPHYVRRDGDAQGVYVRIGSTNRHADEELIQELRRASLGIAFDEQPMLALSSEEIDFRAASELFAGHRTLKRADLETLRLVTEHQGRKVPTVGGYLLFGANRTDHFPDAWIQAGRFGGVNKAHISDFQEIKTHLPVAIQDAVRFVAKHTINSVSIGSTQRSEHWNLPPIAVREAVINAVAHADYSQKGAPIRISIFDDRLEVENPGLLPFGLTIDDLHRGVSKLRNRVIGRTLHELKLIEQWGSGVQRIVTTCIEAGLPLPVFEEIGTRFRVTIKTIAIERPAVDELDQKILNFVATKEGRSTREIAVEIKRTPRATRSRLASLLARGLVREVGTSPQDPKRRYFRAH